MNEIKIKKSVPGYPLLNIINDAKNGTHESEKIFIADTSNSKPIGWRLDHTNPPTISEAENGEIIRFYANRINGADDIDNTVFKFELNTITRKGIRVPVA